MQFEQIWNQFSLQIFNYIKGKISTIEDAEDILQDVFVKVFLKIDSLENIEKVGAWLFQITRNSINDFYRINAKTPQKVDITDLLIKEESTHNFLGCLSPIIDELPTKYKEVIHLSDVEGKKYQEIAKQLDLSLSGVKTRVQRGRELLKQGFINCCQYKKDENGKLIGKNDCQRTKCECSD